MKRPITPIDLFEEACEKASLNTEEQRIIDHIRFSGIFTQPSLTKELNLNSKPPVLSKLCEICRKIGGEMPEHFQNVREWSQSISEYNIKWDGNLICSEVMNIDGEKLSPEKGTSQFHIFAVHKELFEGLE